MDLATFCKALPKIELHAHLNGSISEETIGKLIELKRQQSLLSKQSFVVPELWQTVVSKGRERTMEECFVVFGVIHNLVDSEEAVALVAESVVREFAEDGVVYLELRTTPKAYSQSGLSKHGYICSVLRGVERACKAYPIQTRLLLSIDRGRSPEDAMDTVDLAIKWRQEWAGPQDRILGIDFSGNPNETDVTPFLPALRKAKDAGLKMSLHLSEIDGNVDTGSLLSLRPDRVGHATFLHPGNGGQQEYVDTVVHHKIPIELCLTSNIKSGTVKKIEDHHFGFWREMDHPVILGVSYTYLDHAFSE